MSFDPEKDALQKAATKEKILSASFRVFAERGIESVTMTDAAEASGIGVATVYRHFKTKHDLVVAVGTRVWRGYMTGAMAKIDRERVTAAEGFAFFLDAFLDLYRNHRDLLRFNQFFNVYLVNDRPGAGTLNPYNAMIGLLADRFRFMVHKARTDHTLRTDVPADEMLSASLHLMMAAATRYAVGLVYDAGVDPEKELVLLRNLLFREYALTEA